jgi:serine/threonine protein kinase
MLKKQIHNYKITRKIGSGGMATVYEAVHVKLDSKVAIKVLNPVLAANDGIRKRFEQEAKIMASLNHEGITKVIDFDEDKNSLAIVMEYLNGQTLDEYINQKGALNEDEAKSLFKTILEAFSYAHSKGIVHRDVKPSNIFITTEGKVKIMDFGIAKIIEDGANVLTQTGTQMGTPVYMSPEQVNDSKNIDHRTDIYSLGVMLWYMLSGKPPYDGTTLSSFQIFKHIDSDPLPEIIEHPTIDSIIQKATAKKCEIRFHGCDEFINAFSEIKNTSITNNGETTQIIEKDKDSLPKPDSIQPKNNLNSFEKPIIKQETKSLHQSNNKNPLKENNDKYLILKLIGVSVLVILINSIFNIDSLVHYPINYDDPKFIPMIYFSAILTGIGHWFFLKKYVNLLYPAVAVIYAFNLDYYLPDFFNTFFLYAIIYIGIQFFSLRKKNGVILKWLLYRLAPVVILGLIYRYVVNPLFHNVEYNITIRIISTITSLIYSSVISIFLGLFFIKVYSKSDKIV